VCDLGGRSHFITQTVTARKVTALAIVRVTRGVAASEQPTCDGAQPKRPARPTEPAEAVCRCCATRSRHSWKISGN
jgi:hypothetical protein